MSEIAIDADPAAHRARFLDGLAAEAGVDRAMLDQSGTAVVGREDRAGTGIMVCYWVGPRALVWADPETLDRYRPLVDETTAVDQDAVTSVATAAGLELLACADMRLPTGPIPPVGAIPGAYRRHWLDKDRSDHVDAVLAFVDRSDPDDVEEAALDELDDFDETAINVIIPPETPDDLTTMVAYASACPWDWDPGFGDIGVLVDPAHRGLGLARSVVASTVARLEEDGIIPLYRHDQRNAGSMAIATGLGFEPIISLAYFVPSGGG